MFSRYLFIHILFRVLLIILVTVLGTWLVLSHKPFYYIGFSVLVLIWLSYRLIVLINKVNVGIAYFFNAVENEDSTLHYPEKVSHYSFKALNQSLNRINSLIQDTRMQTIEQEQFMSALLEQVATGIVVINNTGHIIKANSMAKKLLNYRTLTHIVQLKKIDTNLYHAFEMITQGLREQSVTLQYGNTSTQLTLKASQFLNREEEFIIVSIQDIKDELDAKEVESWIKLIRVLTHEIMNSITPIISLSDTLIGYYDLNKNIQPTALENKALLENTNKGLNVINERSKGLIKFVETYRKLTKIPKPVIKPIEVKHWLEQLAVLVKSDPKHQHIEYKMYVMPPGLTIMGDETLLSQVLINLFKNAQHAVVNENDPRITLKVIQEDTLVQITITDNGPGIPKDIIDQIFIPFFTTKELGSGIGLSLSRQIMRLHGGSIKVFSSPGKTQFILEW